MNINYKKIHIFTFLITFLVTVGILVLTGNVPSSVSYDELKGYLEKISPITQETSKILKETERFYSLKPSTQRVPGSVTNITAAKHQFLAYSDDLEKMDVPSGLKKFHKQMKGAIADYSKGFELVEMALEEKNDAKMGEAQTILNQASQELYDFSQKIVNVKTE